MRRLAFAIITAVHVLVIAWIDQALRVRKAVSGKEPPPLVMFFLNAPQARLNARSRSSRPPVDLTPIDPTPSKAITDWGEAARAAAEDYATREDSKSELRSFQHRFAEPAAPERPGVFGLEKRNQRTGMIELGEGNTERHWVTDNCYYEFERGASLPPVMAGAARTQSRKCKPPPTGGGEHLFDDLKPEYLKRPPQR